MTINISVKEGLTVNPALPTQGDLHTHTQTQIHTKHTYTLLSESITIKILARVKTN